MTKRRGRCWAHQAARRSYISLVSSAVALPGIDAHRCTSVQSQRMCTGEENLGHWPTMYNICIRGLSLFQTSRMEKSYSYGVSKTFLIWIPRRQHGISIRSRHHRPENSDWISRFLCQFNLWSTSKIPKLRAPKFRDNSDLKTDREDLRRSWKYEPSHHPFGPSTSERHPMRSIVSQVQHFRGG